MTVEHIARMCHETNRAWCEMNGDTSQQSWNEAALWQRESAMKGVLFAIENPDATPALQHEAWYKDKERDGWMYGPVKDSAKKEHPCMLPYYMLPKNQQLKDRLFVAVVNALRQEVGA